MAVTASAGTFLATSLYWRELGEHGPHERRDLRRQLGVRRAASARCAWKQSRVSVYFDRRRPAPAPPRGAGSCRREASSSGARGRWCPRRARRARPAPPPRSSSALHEEQGLPSARRLLHAAHRAAPAHEEGHDHAGEHDEVLEGDHEQLVFFCSSFIVERARSPSTSGLRPRGRPSMASLGLALHGYAVFFWPERMISGLSLLVTTLSVMMTFLAPLMEGMSNMMSIMSDSTMARRPRAPVLRSMALRAMASMARSSNSSSTSSSLKEAWYCLSTALCGSVMMRRSAT